MLAQRNTLTARPARATSQRARVVARATPNKSLPKEFPRWPEMWQYLKDKQVPSISAEEAQARIASGEWVLVDCRLTEQHQKGTPQGALSAPLYETIGFNNVDTRRVFKALFYMANGVSPVDPNPLFLDQIEEIAKGKGVITMCEAGGTLKPSVNFPCGKPSRSLQAAYLALSGGALDKVAHLDRGVFGWFKAGLPIQGEYKPEIGRTPMAADEPVVPAGARK
ncbi:hypothetical protein HYH03_002594 [Edaphochlamys debaryana]|uniref:Rhodanese domain-containing protein n=1 Tax=Edaphochlamys debaryana TaxID=47281 RepID=A0A835YEY1_9CHLO|nr:hypothetical protein HYH03_002594 [Edaphochlamys debaryana]|eukprot:KAG2499656.1 hypothetical protein HYH03_002594 [Edaphochlamys debaryana]